MSRCSETPGGPSQSQEELGCPTTSQGLALPPGFSNPPWVVGITTSNSQMNRQELREVADLPKDTQLVGHHGEQKLGSLSSQTSW